MASQCYKHRSKGCERGMAAILMVWVIGMRSMRLIGRLLLLLERLLLLEQLLEVETDNNILV